MIMCMKGLPCGGNFGKGFLKKKKRKNDLRRRLKVSR